jgi:hypothetical protein
MRRDDLLRLNMSNLQEDGFQITPGKTEDTTGKMLIHLGNDKLRGYVAMAEAVRPVSISPWLFCNRRGECYFRE